LTDLATAVIITAPISREGQAMVTQETTDRAKAVIVEIVRQSGGTFRNKTNIFKAFWKAHVAAATMGLNSLTGYPIVKMPGGPGIHDFDKLLGALLEDGVLKTRDVQTGPYTAVEFKIAEGSARLGAFTEVEETAIGQGVAFASGKSATEVSDESHLLSRSWRESALGDELDIILDTIPDDEYSERQKAINDIREGWLTIGGN
jgi:hypothetical protein